MYSLHLESVEQMGKVHLVGCRGDEKKTGFQISVVCACAPGMQGLQVPTYG